MATSSGEYSRNFEPSKSLKWTAETDVEFIKNLVQGREDLFAKHRLVVDSLVETQSLAILARLCGKDRRKKSTYNTYNTFCVAVNIKAFPLSISSISLFLVAKCSHKEGYYKTVRNQLCNIYRETVGGWKDVAGYGDVENLEQASAGLKAFMDERLADSSKPRKTTGTEKTAESSVQARLVKEENSSESASDQEEASDSDIDDEWLPGRSSNFKLVPTRKIFPERRATSETVQLPVPHLPQPQDRFTTPNELLIACYRALLPVYGHGVSMIEYEDGSVDFKCGRSASAYAGSKEGCCDWKIGAFTDSSTGEIVVDQASSFLLHNHGQGVHIRNNSSWRPRILNPVIREAFGMVPLNAKRRKIREEIPSTDIGSSKRPKIADLSGAPLAPDPSSFTSQSSFHPALQHSPSSESRNLDTTFPSSTQVPSPSIIRLSLVTSPVRSPFYPELDSFLKALHPSLSSLAHPLIAAGIDSLDALTLFCSLESEMLEKSLKVIQAQAQILNQSLSIIHLKLFKKLVGEAQVQGYIC